MPHAKMVGERQLEAAEMMSRLGRMLSAGIVAVTLGTGAAWAQEDSTNRVDAMTDWSVFEGENPKECWAVSTYKESVNTKDGRVVAVTRGEILLMVFFRPEASVTGQVAFTGGYPFANGSSVTVDISGTEYQLFSEGEWAWPATPADDAKLVTAMKRGSDAVLTGVSSRGTSTKDTFSLLGFTAAVEDAERRCSS